MKGIINQLLTSLARPDSIVGFEAGHYATAIKEMLDAWDWREVYIPSGTDITHMDLSLIEVLKERRHAGLVLMSSGSTGEPKAALHDATMLLKRFQKPGKPKRMLYFMQLDHIGGINTVLHSLVSGGTLVTVKDRKPETICEAIEKYKVQVLPTTPTFLNLLILSQAHMHHDLSSLELITYGTEPMPQTTLDLVAQHFPGVKLKQTYGLSELGIMPTKSRADDSLWIKAGGEGYEIRVVDGLLEIKAETAMLGYLNAPSPFTDDGWFKTGDAVEQDGEWLKILGRKSEVINIGGEKVYPAEIEGILQSMCWVSGAVVTSEPNALMGRLIKATVNLDTNEGDDEFRKRMRRYWEMEKLPMWKMPIKVSVVEHDLHSLRFKKVRA